MAVPLLRVRLVAQRIEINACSGMLRFLVWQCISDGVAGRGQEFVLSILARQL
jgi:hypothetical protein